MTLKQNKLPKGGTLSLPKGWEMKKLGEVIKLEYGKPLPQEKRKSNGKYPIYGANGEIGRTDEFYFNEYSIIVGRKGSAGEINLTENSFWPLDVTYFVVFNKKVLSLQYIYHLLILLNLPNLAKGVKPGINRNEVYNIPIPIPPLPEQERIVSILDKAFADIERSRNAALQNLKNAKELFESYLNGIFERKGEGWEEKKLGEVATFKNGMNFTKSSRGEMIKIVGVKDFQNNFWVPFESLESVTIEGNLNDIDILKENDIIAVRSNGNPNLIGRTLLAESVVGKISHSGFTIRIRINSNRISPVFLCRFLKIQRTRKALIESGTGVNIKSLNQGALSSLLISYPKSLSEQQAIVAKLDALQAETKQLERIYEQKINVLDELKKSILQQAFEGEL